MGQALLGKQLDDEISIRLGHSELNDDIVAIN
jgi:transcription elongation GreA/GreB family factor